MEWRWWPMVEAGLAFLREQAARCCRLAQQVTDDLVRAVLVELADEYEARAAEAEKTTSFPVHPVPTAPHAPGGGGR
jgi:hypothetical protein